MDGDITQLLDELRTGDKKAEARLLDVVYPELRRIAARHLSRERPGHTLAPTALVNEAYLQLAGQLDKNWHNRSHFYSVAAQLMRRILVDYARLRKADKREGGRQRVDLVDSLAITEEELDQVVLIDVALKKLSQFDERKSKVVELRFFGGLTEEEIAVVLQVTARTVKRDWNIAKAWLYGELNRTAESS
jgi:RNA polymerase sigma-70 factor (ECF subfamily)